MAGGEERVNDLWLWLWTLAFFVAPFIPLIVLWAGPQTRR